MRTSLLPMLCGLLVGCAVVPPGHRAVQVKFGDLQEATLEPGMYFSPLTRVLPQSLQVNATEAVASAVTNDLQNVQTTVTLNWSRDADAVREQFRMYPALELRVIDPAIQESVKSVTAQYTATDLVQKRQVVKDSIEALISERLSPLGVRLDTLNITDFAFSQEFNNAIEAKVKAEQEALRSKQELEKVKVVAQQAEVAARGRKAAAILEAEGEAKAIQIQGDALRQNPQVLELRRIARWNGTLPTTLMGGEGGEYSVLIGSR